MTATPTYVDAPGRLVGAAPYRSDEAILWGAFLKGKRAAQQAACDRLLVNPTHRALSFTAITHQVLFASLHAKRTYSRHPRDAGRGATPERDIGFWSLVYGGPRANFFARKLYWLPHFLFVDSATAMASGREVYGYPKDIAAFTFEGPPQDDPRVALTVEHIARFDPTSLARPAQLVRVAGEAAPSLAEDAEALEMFRAPIEADALDGEVINALAQDIAVSGALGALTGAALKDRVRDQLAQDLKGLTPPRMGLPTVLLKQIPDVADPLAAAHQAVVTVEPKAEHTRSVSLRRGDFSATLLPSDSHPIARTLGLEARTEFHWLLRVDMDFSVDPGAVLWRA